MSSWLRRAVLLAALPLAACNLYFGHGGGDDQPPPCGYGADYAGGIRDPQSGACQQVDYGGCGVYDGTSDGSGTTGTTTVGSSSTVDGGVAGGGSGAMGGGSAAGALLPDWATCPGPCEDLGEADCLMTPGCRAIYTGFACPPDADCVMIDPPLAFSQCWETAPSGPIEGGGCWGLDAQTCSEHDDCAATFNFGDPSGGGGDGGCGIPTGFQQCFPEPGAQVCTSDLDCPGGTQCDADTVCNPPPGCDPSNGQPCSDVCYGTCVPTTDVCAAADCGPGYHCEQQCYPCDPPGDGGGCMQSCDPVCVPDQTTCAGVDCGPGQHCEDQCSGTMCDPSGTCPPDVCQPVCVGNPDPGDCYAPVACTDPPPACPPQTTPGVSNGCYTGYCIPIAACGKDPGTCDGPLACDLPPPACPAGTTAGILNGCWSGYCIPDWACTSQEPCAAITDEATCQARSDCTPVYDGMDCTCDPSGVCTCTDQSFARCDDAVMPI